ARLSERTVTRAPRIWRMPNGKFTEAQRAGLFPPRMQKGNELTAAQVGFLTAGIKRVADSRVGETITEATRSTATALPGFREAKPMVFSGLYPVEATEYQALRDALQKRRRNDSAFTYEPASSLAPGRGL